MTGPKFLTVGKGAPGPPIAGSAIVFTQKSLTVTDAHRTVTVIQYYTHVLGTNRSDALNPSLSEHLLKCSTT